VNAVTNRFRFYLTKKVVIDDHGGIMKTKIMLGALLIGALVLSGALAAVATRSDEGPAQQQAEDLPPQQEQPEPPPRIVGQPQTEAEFAAWLAIEAAPTFEEKAQLAQSFLERFPESGLTPYAHQLLALNYQQANDRDRFIYHSEKTLEDLPDNALILTHLAIAYAQKQEPDKAIVRATEGLEALNRMEKPAQLSQAQWAQQRDQLSADAHYAIGVAHMDRFNQLADDAQTTEDPNLKQAADYFENAIDSDPAHDRAYYHLGYVYAKMNEADKALTSYARAAVIGGVAAAPAKDQFSRVYEFVHRNTDGLEQFLDEQREYVQKKIAESEQKLQALEPPPTPLSPE
jgi:tetratricopeptide (TPR) repeat protein